MIQKEIKLLDCTLRDGGYVNNWNFDDLHIISIVNSLVKANIENIECGYLDPNNKYSKNSTRFRNVSDFNKLAKEFNTSRNTNLFLMIDYHPKIELNLPVFSMEGNLLDGIRIAFHKNDYVSVLPFAQELINQGYKICLQPMNTSSYSDKELIHLLQLANKLEIYSFYIVDSFGSMDQHEVKRLFYLVENNLNPRIRIGLHTHNNMQLAFANSIEFLKQNQSRKVMIDSSISGMGRGAGNLNTEIISEYLNKYKGKSYKIIPLLEVMDNFIEAISKEMHWGFSASHYLSAVHRCHPNYSSYLMNKKTLTIKAINKILTSLNDGEKILYNKEIIEEKYFSYLSKRKQPNNFDGTLFKRQKVLALASGNTINMYSEEINNFMKEHNPLVVALNFLPNTVNPNYYFFSNQKRFNEYSHKITDKEKIIITSNIETNLDSIKVVDLNLVSQKAIVDNVAVHFINFLIASGVKSVTLAGIDGYDINKVNNYSYEEYNRVFDIKELKEQNDKLLEQFNSFVKKISIRFLTPSLFESSSPKKYMGVIPARYKSTRFEGKPLALIDGIPMIERTYLQAKKSKALDSLVVATDDKRIKSFCESKNIPVVMTSTSCLTGTDRIAEVSKIYDYDYYINIQGDEPIISPENIDLIINEINTHGKKYIAYNLFKEINSVEEIDSDTIIKTITNEQNELVYMSRLPVPFNKSEGHVTFNKQVCVYGFSKEALDIYSNSKKTRNEQFEDIEILRIIDLGYKVKMTETKYDSITVDRPEDIKKVERFLDANKVKI